MNKNSLFIFYIINTTNGTVEQSIEYDSFGNIISDTNPTFQPFRLADGIYDVDTKLIRFGARDYDARDGRWTAKDPIKFDGGRNFYSYCNGDPINRVDVNGLDWKDDIRDTYNSIGESLESVFGSASNWPEVPNWLEQTIYGLGDGLTPFAVSAYVRQNFADICGFKNNADSGSNYYFVTNNIASYILKPLMYGAVIYNKAFVSVTVYDTIKKAEQSSRFEKLWKFNNNNKWWKFW